MYHSAMIVLFALFQLLCVYSLYSLSRFVAPPWVLPRVLSRGISGGRGAMQQLQQLVPATTSNIGGKVERSEHKANQILQGSETFLNGDNAFEELDAPLFTELRRRFGFSDALYASLMVPDNFESLPDTQSKGGQHIIRLKRGGVVFKTLNRAESRALRAALPSYAEHVGVGATPNTATMSALVGLLGLYRLRFPGGSCLDLVAMRDVVPSGSCGTGSAQVVVKDIKGSTVGRRSRNTCLLVKDADIVLADTPVLEGLGASVRLELLRVLERDTAFLASRGLMDYSLLVVETHPSKIENIDLTMVRAVNLTEALGLPSSSTLRRLMSLARRLLCAALRRTPLPLPAWRHRLMIDAAATSLPSNATIPRILEDRGRLLVIAQNRSYYCAIIDFLQPYSVRKQFESLLKGIWTDAGQVSCADPVRYAARFLAFMRFWSN